jgi:hypothetical protein
LFRNEPSSRHWCQKTYCSIFQNILNILLDLYRQYHIILGKIKNLRVIVTEKYTVEKICILVSEQHAAVKNNKTLFCYSLSTFYSTFKKIDL